MGYDTFHPVLSRAGRASSGFRVTRQMGFSPNVTVVRTSFLIYLHRKSYRVFPRLCSDASGRSETA